MSNFGIPVLRSLSYDVGQLPLRKIKSKSKFFKLQLSSAFLLKKVSFYPVSIIKFHVTFQMGVQNYLRKKIVSNIPLHLFAAFLLLQFTYGSRQKVYQQVLCHCQLGNKQNIVSQVSSLVYSILNHLILVAPSLHHQIRSRKCGFLRKNMKTRVREPYIGRRFKKEFMHRHPVYIIYFEINTFQIFLLYLNLCIKDSWLPPGS